MDELWHFLGQLHFIQDLAITASNTMLNYSTHWIDTPEVLVPPPLITSQVFFGPMMPKNLERTLGLNREVLLAHMAPDHMWIVDRVSGSRNEGPGPPYLGEEFLAHGHPSLDLSLGPGDFLIPGSAFRLAVQSLLPDFREGGILTAEIGIQSSLFPTYERSNVLRQWAVLLCTACT